MELRNKRVLVTGGNGFLGRHLCSHLLNAGAIIASPRSSAYDLRDRNLVNKLYRDFHPRVVVHAAAVCGGIGANQAEPGRFLRDNLLMGINVIDAAREHGIDKFVQLGTVCSYPKHCPTPFHEEDLWNGYPEETNAPYGIAKKTLMEMCCAYRTQYELNAISVIPVNLFGPFDNFHPGTSHVIPALIRKCVEARRRNDQSITVWGSGAASREFLYVEDAAEAIVKATEHYEGGDPVNIGTGSEITIVDLVELVKKTTGYLGKTLFDPSKPDGQPKRRLDVTRARKEFGFEAKTSLEEGLRRTVDWYENSLRHQ